MSNICEETACPAWDSENKKCLSAVVSICNRCTISKYKKADLIKTIEAIEYWLNKEIQE